MSTGVAFDAKVPARELGRWWRRLGSCALVLATVVASAVFIARHSRPWAGPAGAAGAATFLALVVGPWVAYSATQIRARRPLKMTSFLVPVIAVAATLLASLPALSAARWSRSESAFARFDVTLPSQSSVDVTVARAVHIGSFSVASVILIQGSHYYIINTGETDADGCKSGVVHLRSGLARSVGGVTLVRYLGNSWYGFRGCWD